MTDYGALADRLTDAVAAVKSTTPLTNDYPELTVAQGYEIQAEVVRRRLVNGVVISGAKLGLTSEAKQKQMHVTSPIYGWMTSDMLLDTAQPLETARFIHPRCEPEIGFLLGKDLAGAHVSAAHVLDATSMVFGAIDILDSRYAGYSFKHADVVADNASCGGYTFGPVGIDPRGIDLAAEHVVLKKNGEQVHEATGAAVLGHPAASVAWMVRTLAARGEGLKAGHVVMCGSVTEAVPVAPGDVVTAEFDHLGTVVVRCV